MSNNLLPEHVDRVMLQIRREHDHNRRLNDAGITYNVWTSGITPTNCLRCGSAFTGHRCHLVGHPLDAHRFAQPQPEQEVLW